MSKALSLDLRTRVLAAIAGGVSCRQAAQRFGVSASSAIRWRSLERRQGDARPKALGGERRSGRIEARAGLILGLVDETHGHWKTTTFVAGLRLTGLVAPFVLDGPINRDAFEVYV